MKFFKFAAVMLCCMFAMTVVSCNNDDDDNPNQPTELKLSSANAEMMVGDSVKITVTGGTAPYTVASSDKEIDTVKVDKNIITVTGLKAGKATVLVSDKNKQTVTLAVTVKDKTAELKFDKTAVKVAVGKEDTVTVNSGAAPYTATVKDKSIATASVKDGKVVVKGVKAGTTTMTVTDKDKLSGTITITVE